jgi:hypothetical protein
VPKKKQSTFKVSNVFGDDSDEVSIHNSVNLVIFARQLGIAHHLARLLIYKHFLWSVALTTPKSKGNNFFLS